MGSADEYVSRVLDIAGARALALEAFLRVSRVEWCAEVTTACIECADRPRLLLNAAFVEQRCFTPERLATLLLHELAHVSMGHTRMFPRPTVAHNVACDAIINREIAALAVEHDADQQALTALLVESYPANEAPWFLLRPPPMWPECPDWEASRGAPRELRAIHRRLYHPDKPQLRFAVQYSEIVDALQQAARAQRACAQDTDGAGFPADCSALLGGHGDTPTEQRALTGGRDAVASDVLGAGLQPLGGRFAGRGGDEVTEQLRRGQKRASLERALHALLQRCIDGGAQRTRVRWEEQPARTAMPHHDRRGPARVALARAFGAPRPLFFADVVHLPRPEPLGATVYLDTSGSMNGVLPALHAALVPLRKRLRPRILLFSTIVAEATAQDFDAGRLRTTGGTDINPVLRHLLEDEPTRGRVEPRVVVVLTDGYFGSPTTRLVRALRQRGIQLHLGVIGGGPMHEREPWVASATRLPSL